MTIKQGATGWVRGEVDIVLQDGTFLAQCGGCLDARDWMVDSPALVAVAALLADPAFVSGLRSLLEGVDWHYELIEDERAGRALLVALGGGEP